MSRAIYSAVGGLLAHQFKMDVIGNNIANVNTVGFKDARASFQSAFTQESRAASANTPIGLAVGLGVQVSGTQTLFTQGAFQRTDINTDIGLSGSGWFITANGSGSGPATAAPTSSSGFYTRAGNFVLDSERFLRTVDGKYIYGVEQLGTNGNAALDDAVAVTSTNLTQTQDFSLTAGDSTAMDAAVGAAGDGTFKALRIPLYIAVTDTLISDVLNGVTGVHTEQVSNFSIATDGAITVTTDQGTARRTGYAAVAYFNNDSGLRDAGSSYFTKTPASGAATFYQPQTGPAAAMQAGTLELSNVDLAGQFSDMIITQRGFDANARTITTGAEMLQTVINIGR